MGEQSAALTQTPEASTVLTEEQRGAHKSGQAALQRLEIQGALIQHTRKHPLSPAKEVTSARDLDPRLQRQHDAGWRGAQGESHAAHCTHTQDPSARQSRKS